MDKMTALITGANAGMGKETARELAKAGVRLIITSRARESGEAAACEIVNETGNIDVGPMLLDLLKRSAHAEGDEAVHRQDTGRRRPHLFPILRH